MFTQMLGAVLWMVAAAAVWLGVLAVSPLHRCPRCKGRKITQSRRGGFTPCRKCKGTGRACRLGAVRVQRALCEHAEPWLRHRFELAALRIREVVALARRGR